MDIDENNAVDVLAPLREANFAPPRVDLDAAIGVARRRRRVHRAASGGAIVAAIAALTIALPLGLHGTRHTAPTATAAAGESTNPAASAPAPSATTAPTSLTCTEQLLPVGGGVKMALANGGDPTARFLFGRSYPAGKRPQPVIWVDGVAHPVPLPGDDPTLSAVSSNGSAVGVSYSGSTSSAYIYRDNSVSKLRGSTNISPVAIDETGVVVGNADGVDAVPMVWRSPTATAERLAMPGPKWRGSVTAILDDGSIIGTVRPTAASGADQVIIWSPDGGFRLVPPPDLTGIPHATGYAAAYVRNNIIVGNVMVDKPDVEAGDPVDYDLTTGTYSPAPQPKLFPVAGNGHWQVGFTPPLESPTPALWTPGTGIVKLPTLAKKASLGDQAAYISDDGKVIAGQNTDKNGVLRAVVWRCH